MAGDLLDEMEDDPAEVHVTAVTDGPPRPCVQVMVGHQVAIAGTLFLVLGEKSGQRDVDRRPHLRVGVIVGRLCERSRGLLAQEHHLDPVVLDPPQMADQPAHRHQR